MEIDGTKRKLEASRDETEVFREEVSRFRSQCATQASEIESLQRQVQTLFAEKSAIQKHEADEVVDSEVAELRIQLQNELDFARCFISHSFSPLLFHSS